MITIIIIPENVQLYFDIPVCTHKSCFVLYNFHQFYTHISKDFNKNEPNFYMHICLKGIMLHITF